MNVRYHADVDVLRILFRDDGFVVGIEILNASQQMINPREIEYELLEPMPT